MPCLTYAGQAGIMDYRNWVMLRDVDAISTGVRRRGGRGLQKAGWLLIRSSSVKTSGTSHRQGRAASASTNPIAVLPPLEYQLCLTPALLGR